MLPQPIHGRLYPPSTPHIFWPWPPCYYRAKCCNTNTASWNVSDSGWVVRPSVFDLSSLPVDALTGGAPNRHGNKGPLLLLVKGLNCCQDLMIQSSIQGRRYYELFVSSFFNSFPQLVQGFNSFVASRQCGNQMFWFNLCWTCSQMFCFFSTLCQLVFVSLPQPLWKHILVIVLIKHLFPADVKKELDDLSMTMKNFEARVGFAKNLETMSSVSCLTDEVLHNTDMRTPAVT